MKKQRAAEPLAWTGERLVTSCNQPLIYEHLHRYAIACGLAKWKRVLDIACGEGYGAKLLAHVATEVTGVDIDAETIAHAKGAYRHRNLHFLQGSCTEIPCADQSVDLVASFETIEHIREHDRFLQEIKRVLAPGGILVISSPHKAEYRKMSREGNPFHELELDHDEFVQLINQTFKKVVIGKQRLVLGSWIAPDKPSAQVAAATFRGGFDGIEIEPGVYRGLYSIAVCSDQALPIVSLGMFENVQESANAWNLLDRYDTPAQISAQLSQLDHTSAATHQQVEELLRNLDEKSNLVSRLQRESDERARQVERSQREFEEKARHVDILQRENEEKTRQVFHFQRESEELARQLLLLRQENAQQSNAIEEKKERLARAEAEAVDARWEALTLRGRLVREVASVNRFQEAQNQIEALSSERDQLRGMLTSLQTEVEAQRKQMERLKEHLSKKLVLPFGRSQRKLRKLMTKEPEHD
jgi:SAM-dependent methyltransferase